MLYRSIELDRTSPTPWCQLITCSMGLERKSGIEKRRFEAGIARIPSHASMHRTYLKTLHLIRS